MKLKNAAQLFRYALTILTMICLVACKKQLILDAPTNTKNEYVIYDTDANAATALAGIYITMSSNNLWSLCLYPGLSADELMPYSGLQNLPIITAYYRNSLTSRNVAEYDYWGILYPVIYQVNSAIEGLSRSVKLTPSVKQQLLGEAVFLRAFCYFYLVNLYGDVPLLLTTNYEINRSMPRTLESEVWKQIVVDLKDSEQMLSPNYLDGTVSQLSNDRVRATKWAATALLARVYLYTKDYTNAEIKASEVIGNTELYTLPQLSDVFLKNSSESIWQLQPVNPGLNTIIATYFVVPTTGFNSDRAVHLSENLINQFEAGDSRKDKWTNSVVVNTKKYYYPYKYKVSESNEPVTEYTTMIRLAELYLIRAEARIRNSNISGGIEDLNSLRDRARSSATTDLPNPLPSISTNLSLEQALVAVFHERQTELFAEWGHRWLDIKRTGMVDEIMKEVTPTKGGIWNSNWAYYPIPLADVQRNPNLKQNPGYN